MQKKLLVINVLPHDTFQDCHIDGSINVPLEKLPSYAQDLDKEQPIVVYCASYKCPASRNAWKLLNEMGFSNVLAYEGGIAEWFQKGYPSQGACKADYVSQVHEIPEETGQIKVISAQELDALMKGAGLI